MLQNLYSKIREIYKFSLCGILFPQFWYRDKMAILKYLINLDDTVTKIVRKLQDKDQICKRKLLENKIEKISYAQRPKKF